MGLYGHPWPHLCPDGTGALPIIARLADPSLGISFDANTIRFSAGGTIRGYFNSSGLVIPYGLSISQEDNGALSWITYSTATELLTIAAAAYSDTTLTIPANAIIDAVTVRVTTAIPTATTFTVTGAVSGTVFNTADVAVAAGTTDRGRLNSGVTNGAQQAVRITPSATPAANTGRVRVSVFYRVVTPPYA